MSESSSDSSSLASVIRDQALVKPGDLHTLTLLHEKFWARSMAHDETEWRNAQSKSGVQHHDEDGNEHEDENEGNKMEADDGDDDDDGDDGNDDDDDNDDDIPGCYLLNIGFRQLWIRSDYIRVFNAIQDYYSWYAKPRAITPSIVLTGQPGIGEFFSVASSASTQTRWQREKFLDFLRSSSLPGGNETIPLVPPRETLPFCEGGRV